MSDIGLTARQADALFYIRSCLDNAGSAPSFDEIKDYLGLASKSGVHRLVSALEERGFVHRIRNRARALALGPAPTVLCPHCREKFDLQGTFNTETAKVAS